MGQYDLPIRAVIILPPSLSPFLPSSLPPFLPLLPTLPPSTTFLVMLVGSVFILSLKSWWKGQLVSFARTTPTGLLATSSPTEGPESCLKLTPSRTYCLLMSTFQYSLDSTLGRSLPAGVDKPLGETFEL